MKPDVSQRISRHNADNAEREKREAQRITMAIEHNKMHDDLYNWKEDMVFNMYLIALQLTIMIDNTIETNEPKTYGEDWSKEFCDAIELLPEAQRLADDCMMYCIKERKE